MELRIGYNNKERKPLPTQAEFHQSKAKYRLLAGGFGTGKTTSIVLEALKDIAIPNNYGIIGRLDILELRSTTLKELFHYIPQDAIVSHNATERVITFANGSSLFYTNLDTSKGAESKISSLNLGFGVVDQLEEIAESVFLAIQGRLRRSNARRCFYASCNPAGHDWLYHRWKVNELQRQAGLSYNHNYRLFEATTYENIYLPDDYVEELEQYPEQWKKRYLLCSWDNFEGLVYDEYNEAEHLIDDFAPKEGEQYLLVHALDYGYTNPTAILFGAYSLSEKVLYLYNEYYQSGKIIPDIANDYRSADANWKNAYRIADPSIYHTDKDGKSIYYDFLREGIFWGRANNDKMRGYNRVNTFFKQGRLKVCKHLINFRREIGDYRWKRVNLFGTQNAPEEAVKNKDHLMDALRYLVNAIEDGVIEKTDAIVAPARGRRYAVYGRSIKVF